MGRHVVFRASMLEYIMKTLITTAAVFAALCLAGCSGYSRKPCCDEHSSHKKCGCSEGCTCGEKCSCGKPSGTIPKIDGQEKPPKNRCNKKCDCTYKGKELPPSANPKVEKLPPPMEKVPEDQ